jgi:hypothetical protein
MSEGSAGMSGTILDQLRTTLGAAYTIERELGGSWRNRRRGELSPNGAADSALYHVML